MPMPAETKLSLSTILAGVNALATVIAIVGGFMVIGQRDAQLQQNTKDITELRAIVERMAEVQQGMASLVGIDGERISTLRNEISDIKARLDRLDRRGI